MASKIKNKKETWKTEWFNYKINLIFVYPDIKFTYLEITKIENLSKNINIRNDPS